MHTPHPAKLANQSLLLRGVRLADGRGPLDVLLAGGQVAAVGAVAAPLGCVVVDGAGGLLSPAFVEPHIHLDKALILERVPGPIGDVRAAIAAVGRLKPTFTREDILERSERALRMAIGHGSLFFRVHAEVDPIGGLRGLEATLELRQRYRDLAYLQVVAFPQEGIFQAPGTAHLLEEAVRLGADVVGGVPYNDLDARQHVDFVFDLAQRHGVPVDFHADFSDDPRDLALPYIVEKTRQLGYAGRVAVGHATALAALPPEEAQPLIESIAAAGVAVIALPATDLWLSGRGDRVAPRRGLTRVRELLSAGATVACSTNNLRNPFTPFGNADQLENALLLAIAAHLADPDGIAHVYQAITSAGAAILGLDDYTIAPGSRADLVLFDAPTPWEAIASHAAKRLVIARGRVVAETRGEARRRIVV